jgi:predicted DNA-binding transcriptional regulator YafY
MQRTLIREIYKDAKAFGGKTVTLGGWVRNLRDSKAFGFIDLNDGSYFNSIQVVFEIGKTVLSDVEEWLGIENVKKIEDKYIAEVMLPLDNGLVSKIISYGKDLKVISPKSLKEKIMISCSEILNNY